MALRLEEEGNIRLVKRIFSGQRRIFNFKSDWDGTNYIKFNVYSINLAEMKELYDFFGDMNVLITPMGYDKINVKISEKSTH